MSKRKPLEQRISELDAKRQELVARHRKQKRARDTRRKILVGALVLNRIGQDTTLSTNLRDWLKNDLPKYLTRDIDLKLFDDLLGDTASSQDNHKNESIIRRQ